MKVLIDNRETYEVDKNYLHRGQNPRLQLYKKVLGAVVCVQFENNGAVLEEIKIREQNKGYEPDSHKGYWCVKSSAEPVTIKIIEL